MTLKVGINGFGRIGRRVSRSTMQGFNLFTLVSWLDNKPGTPRRMGDVLRFAAVADGPLSSLSRQRVPT